MLYLSHSHHPVMEPEYAGRCYCFDARVVYHRCPRRLHQSLADRLVGTNLGEDWPVFSSAQPMQALDLARSAVGLETKKALSASPRWKPNLGDWAGDSSKDSLSVSTPTEIVYLETSCRATTVVATGLAHHNPAVDKVRVGNALGSSNTGQHQSNRKNECFHVNPMREKRQNSCVFPAKKRIHCDRRYSFQLLQHSLSHLSMLLLCSGIKPLLQIVNPAPHRPVHIDPRHR